MSKLTSDGKYLTEVSVAEQTGITYTGGETLTPNNSSTACTLPATTNMAIIAGYASNVFVGLDEAVWLEGGDNGATYSSDGVHYSAAGQTQKASLLRTLLG